MVSRAILTSGCGDRRGRFEVEAKRPAGHLLFVTVLPAIEKYCFSRKLHVDPEVVRSGVADPSKEFTKIVTVGDEVDRCPVKFLIVQVAHVIDSGDEGKEDSSGTSKTVLVLECQTVIGMDLVRGGSVDPLARRTRYNYGRGWFV